MSEKDYLSEDIICKECHCNYRYDPDAVNPKTGLCLVCEIKNKREKEAKCFNDLIPFYANGENHYSKTQIRALLKHFKSEEESKLEETRKNNTLFSDYTPKECEIYMYAYVLDRINDLGEGILDSESKTEPKNLGLSGRHMGAKTDEFLIEK